MSTPLDEDDKEFLLAIPDNPHSDFDEEIEGYANYWVTTDSVDQKKILTIRFFDPEDESTIEGQWELRFIGGERDKETDE